MTTTTLSTQTDTGYVVAYGHQQAPIYASTPLLAKIEGMALFHVPRNQYHLVSAIPVQEADRENAQFMAYVEHYYERH